MTKDELSKIESSLAAEQLTVENELKSIAELRDGVWVESYQKNEDSETIDEKAQGVTDYDERRAIVRSLSKRLEDIKKARRRIEVGAYLTCASCRDSIEKARLLASPLTQQCMSCARKSTLS